MTTILNYFLILAVALIFQLARSVKISSVLKQVQPHYKDASNIDSQKPEELLASTFSPEENEGSNVDPNFSHPVSRKFHGLQLTGKDSEEGGKPLPTFIHHNSALTSQQSLNDTGTKAFNPLPTQSKPENANDRKRMEAFPDAQSFIISEEQHEQHKVDATVQLAYLCDTFDWLSCTTGEDGGYKTVSGNLGVVVFGLLSNNKKHGIKVYRNSNMKTPGGLMDIDWDEANLVPPSRRPIPVIVKVVLPLAEEQSQYSFSPETSAIEKEVRRGKISTGFRFPSGHRITPDLYDIRIASTGLAHSIHDVAYIQEQILGSNTWDIINQIVEDEKASMTHHLELMLNQFSEWLEAVRAEREQPTPVVGGNLGQRIVAGIKRAAAAIKRGVTSTIRRLRRRRATDLQRKFTKTAERAEEEIWLRAQYRLSLTRFIYVKAEGMWEKMLQCDSHWKNILLVQDTIHTKSQLKRAKQDRGTIILNHRVYLSDISTTSKWEKKDLKKGIVVYRLQDENIKWIDTANALPLEHILNQISREYPNQNPADHLHAPCVFYRDRMHDDFLALHRGGSTFALGAGRTDHSTLYGLAKANLATSSVAHQIYQTYAGSLNYYEENELDRSPIARSPDKEYLDIWRELFTTMEAFDAKVGRLGSTFREMTAKMFQVPVYATCYPLFWQSRIDTSYELIRSIAQSGEPWKRAPEFFGTSCSLTAMRESVKTVLDIIDYGGNQIHPYESVH